MKKKLSKDEKKTLRMLVEEFLEKDRGELSAKFNRAPDYAERLWNNFDAALFKDSIWLDEIDADDAGRVDYPKLLLDYHAYLKPIWEQFKIDLFDFRDRVTPAREQLKFLAGTHGDLPPTAMEFKGLMDHGSILDTEQFYEIKVTVSFDPGQITFYKRSINILYNFIELLNGIDISHFSHCDYCGKCIFITRAGKKYCPGCAAKKYQRAKWESDPEGMREKERDRYQTRKGRPSTSRG